MKTLSWIIFMIIAFIVLFNLSIEESNAYTGDTYKGIPVTYDQNACKDVSIYACYFYSGEKKGTINFVSSIDESHDEFLMEHEAGHYFYEEVISKKERLKWDRISGKYYNYRYEKSGIDISVAYVSDYATTDIKEDFAETFAAELFWKREFSMDKITIKRYYVRYLKNKYNWK